MKTFKSFKKVKQDWFITFLITFLSTVLGVYYGFVLNERRTQKETEVEKTIVINNITQEIANNKGELIDTIKSLESLTEFRNSFTEIDVSKNTYSISKEVYENKFKGSKKFTIKDTLKEDYGIHYRGHLNYEVTLPSFSRIAYETAKYKNIFNQLSFDCLYEIEGTYVDQRRVSKQMNELITALQESDFSKVKYILAISLQFGKGLEERYSEMETTMNTCY